MARNKNKVKDTNTLFEAEELASVGYDPDSPYPPREWPEYDEKIEVDRCCPRCNYQWSSGEKNTDFDA